MRLLDVATRALAGLGLLLCVFTVPACTTRGSGGEGDLWKAVRHQTSEP